MDEIAALRAAVPPLGEPVGIREHDGRAEHPERFCPWCYAVGEAPCLVSRPSMPWGRSPQGPEAP